MSQQLVDIISTH